MFNLARPEFRDAYSIPPFATTSVSPPGQAFDIMRTDAATGEIQSNPHITKCGVPDANAPNLPWIVVFCCGYSRLPSAEKSARDHRKCTPLRRVAVWPLFRPTCSRSQPAQKFPGGRAKATALGFEGLCRRPRWPRPAREAGTNTSKRGSDPTTAQSCHRSGQQPRDRLVRPHRPK